MAANGHDSIGTDHLGRRRTGQAWRDSSTILRSLLAPCVRLLMSESESYDRWVWVSRSGQSIHLRTGVGVSYVAQAPIRCCRTLPDRECHRAAMGRSAARQWAPCPGRPAGRRRARQLRPGCARNRNRRSWGWDHRADGVRPRVDRLVRLAGCDAAAPTAAARLTDQTPSRRLSLRPSTVRAIRRASGTSLA